MPRCAVAPLLTLLTFCSVTHCCARSLLLACESFIPYLVDALLLAPDHPRQKLPDEGKGWCQQTHAECFAQLAVFAPAREALLADASVVPALNAVAAAGLTSEAQQLAQAALAALSDKQLEATEGQKHVMLSCASLSAARCVCRAHIS